MRKLIVLALGVLFGLGSHAVAQDGNPFLDRIDELKQAQYKAEAEENLIYAKQAYERIMREEDYHAKLQKQEADALAKHKADLARAETEEQRETIKLYIESAQVMHDYHRWLQEYHDEQVIGHPKFSTYETEYKNGLKALEDGQYKLAAALFESSQKGLDGLRGKRKTASKALRAEQSCDFLLKKVRVLPDPEVNGSLKRGQELYAEAEQLFASEEFKGAYTTFLESRIQLEKGLAMVESDR